MDDLYEDEMNILLVGIDGMDWTRLSGLIEEGQLHNIKGILKSAFCARLRSDSALSCPSFWTSVATGVSQDKHQIFGEEIYFIPKLIALKREWPFKHYFKLIKTGPYPSYMRKTKALWNMLTENERSVGVVGWWHTYPAEKVKGYIITPYNYSFNQIPLYKPEPKFYTFPEDLYGRLQHIAVSSGELLPEELKQMGINIPFGSSWHLARDLSFANISYYMIKNWKIPDLFMVFFESIRSITSRYYNVTEKNENNFQGKWEMSLRQHYVFIDEIIGKLWHLMPKDDSIILIVSNPCFRNISGNLADGECGVFILAGNGIAQNAKAKTASVLDVTPNVLALLGLPIADDFEGRVLVESFSKEFRHNKELSSITTYG